MQDDITNNKLNSSKRLISLLILTFLRFSRSKVISFKQIQKFSDLA